MAHKKSIGSGIAAARASRKRTIHNAAVLAPLRPIAPVSNVVVKLENFVHVVVTLNAQSHRAQAGSGIRAKIASHTGNPEFAAARAAAKYFDVPESQILVRRMRVGDCCRKIKELYTARVVGGAA